MRIRFKQSSARWLQEMHDYVVQCDIRGPVDRFTQVASDVLDGWAMRSELADLTKRRLLEIIHCGFDDSMGRDPLRDRNPDLCGGKWTVYATPRLIRALWANRIAGGPLDPCFDWSEA